MTKQNILNFLYVPGVTLIVIAVGFLIMPTPEKSCAYSGSVLTNKTEAAVHSAYSDAALPAVETNTPLIFDTNPPLKYLTIGQSTLIAYSMTIALGTNLDAHVGIDFKTGAVTLPTNMPLPVVAVEFWKAVAGAFPESRAAIIEGAQKDK